MQTSSLSSAHVKNHRLNTLSIMAHLPVSRERAITLAASAALPPPYSTDNLSRRAKWPR